MVYQERIKYSAAASVLVHLVALVFAGYEMSTNSIGIGPKSTPIILNLQPRMEREQIVDEEKKKPEKMLRLIEPGAPTNEQINDTDLISSQSSKAQSNRESEGDPDKPSVDRIADFDQLGGQTVATPQQSESAPPIPRVTTTPNPQAASEPELAAKPAESLRNEDGAVKVAALEPSKPSLPKPKNAPEPSPEHEPLEAKEVPMQMAQAPEQPSPPPVQELTATRGREDGGAPSGGFTNFEAKRHELGAYMLDVRKHVEREWRTALATRFVGIGPARAVLDCSIRPDGTLEYVRIVDSGNSPGFATLCKAAVERASRSFKPFPFEVPEIYRSKNLEVRWQFTYM